MTLVTVGALQGPITLVTGRVRPASGAAARQREAYGTVFNTPAPGTDVMGVLVRAK